MGILDDWLGDLQSKQDDVKKKQNVPGRMKKKIATRRKRRKMAKQSKRINRRKRR